MLDTVNGRVELRATLKPLRREEKRIALVATMGNLHEGHLALARRAAEIADYTVASVFVNPFQFGEGEDFATYPRTLDEDRRLLTETGCNLLFLPEVDDVYPNGPYSSTRVEVPELGGILCGESRPLFFRGVSTVVTILFNLVQPDVATFGEKDYQQLMVVRRMVEDLQLPVSIEPVATVREPDGVAMSSRNRYLSAAERQRAPCLYEALLSARQRILDGERDYSRIGLSAMRTLAASGFGPEYFTVRRAHDLGVPEGDDVPLVILAAAWLGKARLIDNIKV